MTAILEQPPSWNDGAVARNPCISWAFLLPLMHQNAFGGRALPGPAGGAYSAPPGPLAGLNGKEREGECETGKGRGVQRQPATQNASQKSPEGQK